VTSADRVFPSAQLAHDSRPRSDVTAVSAPHAHMLVVPSQVIIEHWSAFIKG
jgi:hypothetical protein